MEIFQAKKFNIPKLEGISEKQIEEHLKLYEGYVKHSNKVLNQIESWAKEGEENSYLITELQRRFPFEFNGMRSHEYYFGALEGGSKEIDGNSNFGKAVISQYGDIETFLGTIKNFGKTRGSGWCMVYWDKVSKMFIVNWIDEHHLGYLSSLDIVLAVDVWEHAFMVDYLPGERGKYLESYLSNVNWETVNKWFEEASS